MTTNGDRALLPSLPLPLAQAWRRTLCAEAPLEGHERALLTLEAVIKYLAAVAAATWVVRGAEGDVPRTACEALVRPSLGQWAGILRACAPALPDGDPIHQWLDRVRAAAVAGEVEGLPGRTIDQVLQAVPAYRNTIAHGAGLTPERAAEVQPAMLALTRAVLTSLLGEDAPILAGIAGARRVRLMGEVTLEPGAPDQVSGTVAIRLAGESVVLSPLWILDPAEDDILVLNKGAGLKKVEYLSYGRSRGATGLSVRKGDAAKRASQFLESATGRTSLDAADVAELVEETEVKELAGRATGRRIGSYRIVRQVAKGGQGVIYEAIQEDPPRRVALKVLHLPSAVDDVARKRFKEEGAALAKIDHPGVVPVYAAGEQEGVPYLAMKFVEGKTLGEVLEALQGHAGAVTLLDWNRAASSATDRPDAEARKPHAERVAAIARDAARALQACHENSVVHRDVKPGNIMLDEEGRVQLTDFGLARQTEARTKTITRRFVGTLQYAAPEALLPAGKRGPDARVDVYGLGATLYETLALRRPFQEYEADEGALLHAVQAKEPPALKKLAPWVPKDLATITMKALEKDRDKRYRTAAELADDLERYLGGEPIRARPPGPVGRVHRWAKRRPAMAALMLVLVLGTPVVSGLVVDRIQRAEEIRKAAELRQQLEIDEHLGMGFLRMGEGDFGDARAAFKQAIAVAEMPPPEAVGGLVMAYGQQGLSKRAIQILDEYKSPGSEHPALRRIRAQALRNMGQEARAAEVEVGIGEPQDALSCFLRGQEELSRGERGEEDGFRAALRWFTRAILYDRAPRAIYFFRRAVAASECKDPEAAAETAHVLTTQWGDSATAWYFVGYAYQEVDIDRAIVALHEAIRLKPDYAAAYNNLGGALDDKGQLDEAIAAYREAIRLKQAYAMAYDNLGNALHRKGLLDEAIAAHHEAIRLKPEYTPAYSNLGIALIEKGLLDEAIAASREAIRLKPDYAKAYGNLGNALADRGLLDEAIAAYREVIRLKPDHETHYNLGVTLRENGQLDEAIAAYREAIRLKPDHAKAHNNLGFALAEKGLDDEAIAAYREAIRLKPDMAKAHYNLGIALSDKGQLDEAIAAYRESIRLEPDDTKAHYNLGNLLSDKGLLDESIAAYREAIRLKPDDARAHYNLGNNLLQKGQLDEAIAADREAIRLKPDHARAHHNLGVALSEKGLLDEAITAFREAIRLKPDYARAFSNLGSTLGQKGQLDEAITACREAIQRQPGLAEAHFILWRVQQSMGHLGKALHALRRGHEIGSRRAHWPHPTARWVADCEVRCIRGARGLVKAGFGGDSRLDDPHRVESREKAREWLREVLTGWRDWLEKGLDKPARIRKLLKGMRRDPVFNKLRDPELLARLPESEQKAWRDIRALMDEVWEKVRRP